MNTLEQIEKRIKELDEMQSTCKESDLFHDDQVDFSHLLLEIQKEKNRLTMFACKMEITLNNTPSVSATCVD